MAKEKAKRVSTNSRAEGLPEWLTRKENGAFAINADIVYPAILDAWGQKPDQYTLETAYQVAKLEAQRVLEGTEHDPRPDGTLVLLIETEDKGKWALANYPKAEKGKDANNATFGREAKAIYQRLIGKF